MQNSMRRSESPRISAMAQELQLIAASAKAGLTTSKVTDQLLAYGGTGHAWGRYSEATTRCHFNWRESYAVDVTLVETFCAWWRSLVPQCRALSRDSELRKRDARIDLKSALICRFPEYTKQTRIMAVSLDKQMVGMIVDAVSEVAEIPPDIIEPPSPILLDVDSDFLKGIAKMPVDGEEGRLVIILDLARVLSEQSQEALAEFAENVQA